MGKRVRIGLIDIWLKVRQYNLFLYFSDIEGRKQKAHKPRKIGLIPLPDKVQLTHNIFIEAWCVMGFYKALYSAFSTGQGI